jgi:hypothetical protein
MDGVRGQLGRLRVEIVNERVVSVRRPLVVRKQIALVYSNSSISVLEANWPQLDLETLDHNVQLDRFDHFECHFVHVEREHLHVELIAQHGVCFRVDKVPRVEEHLVAFQHEQIVQDELVRLIRSDSIDKVDALNELVLNRVQLSLAKFVFHLAQVDAELVNAAQVQVFAQLHVACFELVGEANGIEALRESARLEIERLQLVRFQRVHIGELQ